MKPEKTDTMDDLLLSLQEYIYEQCPEMHWTKQENLRLDCWLKVEEMVKERGGA